MLRELNTNEMEIVSGGTGAPPPPPDPVDEVITEGQVQPRADTLVTSMFHWEQQGLNILNSIGDNLGFGDTGGGSAPTDDDANAEDSPQCTRNQELRDTGLEMMQNNAASTASTSPVPGARLGIVSFVGGAITAAVSQGFVAANC